MNKASFLKTSAWFNCHPKCHKLLIFSEKFSVAVYYIAYIILLVLLLYQKNSDLIRAILVPAITLGAGSLLRKVLNCPRPYEIWQTTPLVPKDKQGQSFPSRHALSAAVITAAWFWQNQIVGYILCVMLILVCLVRVVAGVHFWRDVLAGVAFGGLLGVIGFFVI